MPQIGIVTKQLDGSYKGNIRTLTITADIRIIPNRTKAREGQPDYRVLSGNVELGAAWDKVGQTSGNPYVSLTVSAPEFGPRKLYANLGQAAGQDDPDVFAIVTRPGSGQGNQVRALAARGLSALPRHSGRQRRPLLRPLAWVSDDREQRDRPEWQPIRSW